MYYAHRGGKFVFASEIKPILASAIVPTEMDQDALSELAIFRYVVHFPPVTVNNPKRETFTV